MRILVLHSDVAPDAPPDELDTLVTAAAVAEALRGRGHDLRLARFVPDPGKLEAAVADAEVVFNLVESVHGQGILAAMAPAMLERLGGDYTGAGAAAIAVTSDKPAAKHILRAAGLPTPDWAEAPRWEGLEDDCRCIVKSATEDASLGLDDGAVVFGRSAMRARAKLSEAEYGGRWFAEAYIEGREFNIALMEQGGEPVVLPMAEMQFVDWAEKRAKIVGYSAKWDDTCEDAMKTARVFGVETEDAQLARRLRDLAMKAWKLFGLRGYARVDFRVDAQGAPTILEINPNPCLEPLAGFAAASEKAGHTYAELVERIVYAALRD